MDAAHGVIVNVVGTLDNDGAVALNQHLHAVHLVHLGAPEAREWLGRSGLT